MVSIRCLGVFTVESGKAGPESGRAGSGTVARIMPPCRRTQMFALLVLNSGTPVATARLIYELWGDTPPDNAKNALYAQVVRLRRDLHEWAGGTGPVLRTQFPGYQLDLGGASLDTEEFNGQAALARRLRRDDPARAIEIANRALALWRGAAFTGMTLGPSGEGIRMRLEEDHFALLLESIEMRLDRGEHAVLLPELRELVQRWPLCEGLHAHLMTALYRTGRLADAVHAFRAARERFHHELGADPSPQLSGLVTLMLRHDPVLWHTGSHRTVLAGLSSSGART